MVFLLRFLEIEKKLFSLKRLFSFFDSIWSGRQSALKKYTLEVWQVCLKRADIRTILYSPHYQQKKIFYFSFPLPIYISRIKWSNHILEFSITILQKKTYEYDPPSPTLFGLNDTCQICFDFVCRIQIKKVTTNLMIFKKKILRKMTWIPIQSFVHRDYSRKKNPWLLSTTFSRYFTISNSKIIPFFSVALFSLYYYPHTTIPAPFLCFWKTPSRLLLPSFSEKLKDWLL